MGAVTLDEVIDDLATEQRALAGVLDELAPEQWDAPTPAAGWTIRHQVAHLAFGDELAATAITRPVRFQAELGRLLADLAAVDAATNRDALDPPEQLRARWERATTAVIEALRRHHPAARIAWVLGPMTPMSFATARLMETFAHGHDVHAGIGGRPEPSARLRHVCDLGVRTREFSFRSRGTEAPPAPRVELEAQGESWSWGEPGAEEAVSGDALEFCEVVTQRRHLDDTGLVTRGPDARRWLEIAQAFAGPPTDGPPPTR